MNLDIGDVGLVATLQFPKTSLMNSDLVLPKNPRIRQDVDRVRDRPAHPGLN